MTRRRRGFLFFRNASGSGRLCGETGKRGTTESSGKSTEPKDRACCRRRTLRDIIRGSGSGRMLDYRRSATKRSRSSIPMCMRRSSDASAAALGDRRVSSVRFAGLRARSRDAKRIRRVSRDRKRKVLPPPRAVLARRCGEAARPVRNGRTEWHLRRARGRPAGAVHAGAVAPLDLGFSIPR